MKITVNKDNLLSKLRDRLTDYTEGLAAREAAREEYVERVTKWAKKQAPAQLKIGDGVEVKLNDSKTAFVMVKVDISDIECVPCVERPYRLSGDVENLRKAISTLELSTDTELVITEKDNYFRFLQ